ncbi:GNAT family N-acetyltransferase [Ruegeria hyattellae]|uniref:GNAT family N-acetyltransferase n=1 Tax=Ruegeria hyattellae TaxID=3233337 RepID=UPI00355BE1BF
MIRSVPMINTARLTLSGMRPEDFDRYAEIWADPDVIRYTGGRPRSRGEAWTAFLRNAGHWQMTGFGQWAVIEQKTRRMIGQAGFFFTDRALGEDFDAFPEVGWLLAPEARGKGYGYEAAQAAHDWFDRVIPGPLVAMIDTDNPVSHHLAGRLGYAPLRDAVIHEKSVSLLCRKGPPARI